MKDTPIPEKLGCLVNADEIAQAKWRPVWVALPPHLDRLLRASPKLAEALRRMKDTADAHGPCEPQHRCSACQMAYKKTVDALALLEPRKGDDDATR